MKFISLHPNTVENIVNILKWCSSSLGTLMAAENFVGQFDIAVFQRFTELEWLDLRSTQLMEFDLSTIKSQQLFWFDISMNDLKRLDNANVLQSWKAFNQTFRVDGNKFVNAIEIIQNIPPVLNLNLSGNDVGTVNANTFRSNNVLVQ